MTAKAFDIVIIGAGVAGASAACALASKYSVGVLEMEEQPGFHTTGRSAAFFSEIYGNAVMRALTSASRRFFESPPDGFAENPLLAPSGALFVARDDQLERLDAFYDELAASGKVDRTSATFALEKAPILNPAYVAGCVWEPGARAIDVNELHQGYLKSARAKGAEIVCRAEVVGLSRSAGAWEIETTAGTYAAPVVVNAAGAWADKIAALAGAAPVGLTPMRRSIATIPLPEEAEGADLPLVIDVDEEFYFKPSGGAILLSPADETPSEPCDAWPEDIDIAVAVDRFEKATTVKVRRLLSSWAGLRTFASDRSIVIGFDPDAEGFFWLAGQGGYGIQTSPAAARCAAALIEGDALPDNIAAQGVSPEALSPARFR